MSNDSYPIEYECSGLVLPIFYEGNWSTGVRAGLYLLALLWSFLGVAIIADIFMCSIEKITSHTRKIKVSNPEAEDGFEEIEIKVWNDTVANLTLMALGSSAPEILLSVIEIVGNNFEAGKLGPSTIVGSAAFNLLVITAVCIVAIPDGETRVIKVIKVFAVTAFFSIFAYIWLIIILIVNTPNIVDLWEAVVTFLMFPILIIIAYMVDRDFCGGKKKEDKTVELGFAREDDSFYHQRDGTNLPWIRSNRYREEDIAPNNKIDENRMREIIKELRKIHPNMTEDQIARVAAARMSEEQSHSRLWYRINATRNIGGNRKPTIVMSDDLHEVFDHMKRREAHEEEEVSELQASFTDLSEGNSKGVIEFTATRSAILESGKQIRVEIVRHGKTNCRAMFRVETIDGTAEATKDYHPYKETHVFDIGETSKHIDIEIIDDNEWEPDEIFFVKLSLIPSDASFKTTKLGKKAIQEITIINDDEPGTFEFSKPSLLFKESAGKALIPVERHNGADGRVIVKWKTEDMTAVNGSDYEGGEGELIFEHGEQSKVIEIKIRDDAEAEKDEAFLVSLEEIATPGAKFGRIKKTVVTIINDDDFNGMVSRLVDLTNVNIDSLRVETLTWGEQFRNALNVNGGDVENATNMDYVMHFLTFGWKVIFALVPPPSIAGGWLAFGCALFMIAILTAVIGDLASIFGCIVTLKDSVTAITLVALGTSLPDTFASKQAATQEKTADNSIGNITGSNSVNVFLGLGMPWLIAAIYHTAKDDSFRVAAGSLGFSVTVFTCCGLLCFAVLIMRRYLKVFGPAELGGAKIPKYISAVFLVFLWILYVILSALQAYGHIKVNF